MSDSENGFGVLVAESSEKIFEPEIKNRGRHVIWAQSDAIETARNQAADAYNRFLNQDKMQCKICSSEIGSEGKSDFSVFSGLPDPCCKVCFEVRDFETKTAEELAEKSLQSLRF